MGRVEKLEMREGKKRGRGGDGEGRNGKNLPYQ